MKEEFDEINARLVQLMRSGAKADGADVQAAIKQHHQLITKFWTPDRESYIGLGQLYTQHPEFSKMYYAIDSGLAEFLAAAMKHFAEQEFD